MSIWAVIPAKNPHAAKTRLAPALSAQERAALARRLLAGTVGAALRCPALSGVLVVSAAAELRALALDLGARAYADPATADPAAGDPLNAAIALGLRRAADLGATAVLVLPADLPLLSPDVIMDFVDEAGDTAVALAPDRSGTGTNALLLRPPRALDPLFGPGSFARHRAAARVRGHAVTTVYLPALAFDLDTPDDLALLRVTRVAGPSSAEAARYG